LIPNSPTAESFLEKGFPVTERLDWCGEWSVDKRNINSNYCFDFGNIEEKENE
jgi:hypothetical protein